MIINMSGGGGGAGATLVVTGVTGSTCIVSKDTKTYTKTFGVDSTATFKGLTTGTWTVTMTNSTQTAVRTIVITSDYTLTIAYFSAIINITYPANSTCVVKDSDGTQVAADTNNTDTAKTFTATVDATGTYTITATSADGSKTASKAVSITAEGQSESVILIFVTYLIKDTTAVVPFKYGGNWQNVDVDEAVPVSNSVWTTNALVFETGKYKEVTLVFRLTEKTDYLPCLSITNHGKGYWGALTTSANSAPQGAVAYTVLAESKLNTQYTLTLDVSNISGSYDINYGGGQITVVDLYVG